MGRMAAEIGFAVRWRFWRFVARGASGDCWDWKGATSRGYGVLRIAGRNVRAHRLSFEIDRGRGAGDAMVCHRCDNRRCVNPRHLFLGTADDNTADAIRKGRFVRGPGCRNESTARLTPHQVQIVRTMLMSGEKQAQIARRFGVSKNAICAIANGKTWRWLQTRRAA